MTPRLILVAIANPAGMESALPVTLWLRIILRSPFLFILFTHDIKIPGQMYACPGYVSIHKKQEDTQTRTFLFSMVGEAGLEPARPQ